MDYAYHVYIAKRLHPCMQDEAFLRENSTDTIPFPEGERAAERRLYHDELLSTVTSPVALT